MARRYLIMMADATFRKLVKGLTRYWAPARGAVSLFRWGDVLDAYQTPRPVPPKRAGKGATKGKAAA